MSKTKAAPKAAPVEPPKPVVYCTPGDLVGTPRPDGGHITSTDAKDLQYIEKAAGPITEALKHYSDPDSKTAATAARWANIVGAVDLRCLGEAGAATHLSLSVFLSEFDDLDG